MQLLRHRYIDSLKKHYQKKKLNNKINAKGHPIAESSNGMNAQQDHHDTDYNVAIESESHYNDLDQNNEVVELSSGKESNQTALKVPVITMKNNIIKHTYSRRKFKNKNAKVQVETPLSDPIENRKRKHPATTENSNPKIKIVRKKGSPRKLMAITEKLNDDQKSLIEDISFDSLLQIKCSWVHENLISWIVSIYDMRTSMLVIPERGSVPVNEDAVHRLFGIPKGELTIDYNSRGDSETRRMFQELFGCKKGRAPLFTTVEDFLKESDEADEKFIMTWLCFALSTFLCPKMSYHLSYRGFHAMTNISDITKHNFCKLLVEQLRVGIQDFISKKKQSVSGCLFFLMILYLDSLSVPNMSIPDEKHQVSVWNETLIQKVIQLDKISKNRFGKLHKRRLLASAITDMCVGFEALISKVLKDYTTEDSEDIDENAPSNENFEVHIGTTEETIDSPVPSSPVQYEHMQNYNVTESLAHQPETQDSPSADKEGATPNVDYTSIPEQQRIPAEDLNNHGEASQKENLDQNIGSTLQNDPIVPLTSNSPQPTSAANKVHGTSITSYVNGQQSRSIDKELQVGADTVNNKLQDKGEDTSTNREQLDADKENSYSNDPMTLGNDDHHQSNPNSAQQASNADKAITTTPVVPIVKEHKSSILSPLEPRRLTFSSNNQKLQPRPDMANNQLEGHGETTTVIKESSEANKENLHSNVAPTPDIDAPDHVIHNSVQQSNDVAKEVTATPIVPYESSDLSPLDPRKLTFSSNNKDLLPGVGNENNQLTDAQQAPSNECQRDDNSNNKDIQPGVENENNQLTNAQDSQSNEYQREDSPLWTVSLFDKVVDEAIAKHKKKKEAMQRNDIIDVDEIQSPAIPVRPPDPHTDVNIIDLDKDGSPIPPQEESGNVGRPQGQANLVLDDGRPWGQRIIKRSKYQKSPYIDYESKKLYRSSDAADKFYAKLCKYALTNHADRGREIFMGLQVIVKLGEMADSLRPLGKVLPAVAEMGIQLLSKALPASSRKKILSSYVGLNLVTKNATYNDIVKQELCYNEHDRIDNKYDLLWETYFFIAPERKRKVTYPNYEKEK
ncbi:hypothetical protein EJB05_29367, partial [Eragrostis curvula]